MFLYAAFSSVGHSAFSKAKLFLHLSLQCITGLLLFVPSFVTKLLSISAGLQSIDCYLDRSPQCTQLHLFFSAYMF